MRQTSKSLILLGVLVIILVVTICGTPVHASSSIQIATLAPAPMRVAVNNSSSTAYDNPTPVSTPTPTLVVAAHDSLQPEEADFVCDGFNDLVEIQAAIDALPTDGGRVLLLAGTFYISSTILLDSYITLEGKGNDTLLYLVDNSNCDVISNKGGYDHWVTNVTVRNLRIDGNKNNQSDGCGIRRTGKYAVYENLLVENTYRRGIHHIWGDHTRIENNTVRDCGGRGISLDETYEGVIVNNAVYNSGLTKENNEDRVISVFRGANNKINYNTIYGGGLSRQIGAWDSPHIEIIGNTLLNGLFMGIAPHSRYARIIDNTIINSGDNAIDLTGENDNWVEGNTISGVSGGKENSGICVNSERSTIINNYIEFSGRAGIHIDSSTSNHILDNTIRNSGQDGRGGKAGIWVQIWDVGTVNSGTVIRGNICFDDQDIPTQLYGVILNSSLGYIDDIVIEDNDLRNNGTAAINSYNITNVRNPIILNNLGVK